MSEIKLFDTVATPDGNATVVGLLPDSGQVEVRYPSRNLLIWGMTQVKLVEGVPNGTVLETTTTETLVDVAPATPDSAYRQAREAGMSPTVPADAFGDEMVEPPIEAKRSTLAEKVANGGKMTKQQALAKARAARAAKRQES